MIRGRDVGSRTPPEEREPTAPARARFVITLPHASGGLPHWLSHWESHPVWLALADTHHALDRQVAELGNALVPELNAVLVGATHSRLVFDANRQATDETVMVREVPGFGLVPFNEVVEWGDLAARQRAHRAFHSEICREITEGGALGASVFLIDLHTFHRQDALGKDRDVDIGVCAPGNLAFALDLLAALRARTTPRHRGNASATRRIVNVRLDEPYPATHAGAFITRRHGTEIGAAVVEVCDDLLASRDDLAAVARLLAEALSATATGDDCEIEAAE